MSNTMGFLGTANSAGTVGAYLALGFITDLLGIGMAFYFSAGLFLLGITIFALLWR
jgi:hypothetical protein